MLRFVVSLFLTIHNLYVKKIQIKYMDPPYISLMVKWYQIQLNIYLV